MQTQEFPPKMEEPLEDSDGNPVIWENPDVPDLQKVLDGDVTEFFCPYPDCGDDFQLQGLDGTRDENREALRDLIASEDGTWRCAECNEPLYGFYGNGDHAGDP